jgi:hypothetical protein
VVSYDEACLIFSKWEEEKLPLLFRSHSPQYTHYMLCGMDSAKDGVLRLRLSDLGYIDVRISAEFAFEYFDPTTERDTTGEALPKDPADPPVGGAGIAATNPAGEIFILLEIIFP